MIEFIGSIDHIRHHISEIIKLYDKAIMTGEDIGLNQYETDGISVLRESINIVKRKVYVVNYEYTNNDDGVVDYVSTSIICARDADSAWEYGRTMVAAEDFRVLIDIYSDEALGDENINALISKGFTDLTSDDYDKISDLAQSYGRWHHGLWVSELTYLPEPQFGPTAIEIIPAKPIYSISATRTIPIET